jgi:hypothetical protein
MECIQRFDNVYIKTGQFRGFKEKKNEKRYPKLGFEVGASR